MSDPCATVVHVEESLMIKIKEVCTISRISPVQFVFSNGIGVQRILYEDCYSHLENPQGLRILSERKDTYTSSYNSPVTEW